MRKLKIGVICYPTVGGSGIVATELGMALARRGHEIHFFSTDVPFRLTKCYPNVFFHQAEINQYSVFQYPPYSITLASKIAELAKQDGLDILHAHYAIPHAVCGILAKQMTDNQLKVVTTLHGTDITVLAQDSSLQEIIRFAIEKSDAVTAVSDSLKNQTIEAIYPDQSIQTIYNFIDENKFVRIETNLKQELGISNEEKVVLHVSNFRKVKRIDQIVRVFAKSVREVPARLLLVGDGPEWSYINRLTGELGIEDLVMMIGKQENLQEIFSIADAFLLMSEKESFGVVLIEAMASGVPCIGTAIGGIPEVIQDGQNGFVVPLGDVDLASEKLVALLTEPLLHQRMARNALVTIQERFQMNRIVNQYENLYYQTLQEVLV